MIDSIRITHLASAVRILDDLWDCKMDADTFDDWWRKNLQDILGAKLALCGLLKSAGCLTIDVTDDSDVVPDVAEAQLRATAIALDALKTSMAKPPPVDA